MRKRIVVILLLIIPVMAIAQRRNRYKFEWFVCAGASNFLGELGGADKVGTYYLKDLEFSASRPAVAGGIRYKNSRFLGFKGVFSAGVVNGDDQYTKEIYRHNRNLNFRSPITEISLQIEGYALSKDRQGHVYKIKNAKGSSRFDLDVYAFTGIAVFFFNPQGKYKGTWINLRPLSTEGQGLPGGAPSYSLVSFAIPMGFGLKQSLDRHWSIGVEYGLRKTFTDYIDDVSTVYYDKDIILAQRGITAQYMADPSLHDSAVTPVAGQEITDKGMQRGNPKNKDSYMFAMTTLSYKIVYKKKTRSKF